MKKRKAKRSKKRYPIHHWSHSSLLSFLRNPLAWYKRYVEKIQDLPSTPSSAVGRSGHKALEYFYSLPERANEETKEYAIRKGLEYLRSIPDFEIDFGKITTKKGKAEKRLSMEKEYLQAIRFYLDKPPRHRVVGVEVVSIADVPGLPLPVKAISDLVVESKGHPGALDIVDHKFVQSFSTYGAAKTLFVIQAIFNYYTVSAFFGRPVRRFIVIECKKSRNADGKPQLRRYVIDYEKHAREFTVFRRLLKDASEELLRTRTYLPNPSDMFEGENSFDIYRLGLAEEEGEEL